MNHCFLERLPVTHRCFTFKFTIQGFGDFSRKHLLIQQWGPPPSYKWVEESPINFLLQLSWNCVVSVLCPLPKYYSMFPWVRAVGPPPKQGKKRQEINHSKTFQTWMKVNFLGVDFLTVIKPPFRVTSAEGAISLLSQPFLLLLLTTTSYTKQRKNHRWQKWRPKHGSHRWPNGESRHLT